MSSGVRLLIGEGDDGNDGVKVKGRDEMDYTRVWWIKRILWACKQQGGEEQMKPTLGDKKSRKKYKLLGCPKFSLVLVIKST